MSAESAEFIAEGQKVGRLYLSLLECRKHYPGLKEYGKTLIFKMAYSGIEHGVARRMRMSCTSLYQLVWREMFEIIVEGIVTRQLASHSTVPISRPEALAFIIGRKTLQSKDPGSYIVYRYYIW